MIETICLPNDINELKKLLLEKDQELREKQLDINRKKIEISNLNETIRFLRRAHFAPKSEIVPSEQLGLFNEIEDILNDSQKEDEEKIKITYERKKRGKREKIPDHLPRIDDIIDLSDEEKTCPHDGTPLEKIGEEVSEKLKYTPAKIEVIRTIRPKYAACPLHDHGVKIASLPPAILPKTMATPSLIAAIVVSKFADYLPLYRQENIFKRIGLEISRQTMARWLISVSGQLMVLYNLLEEILLDTFYLQMDETYTQVLNEKGKKATTKSYIWVRLKPFGEKIVLFDYDPRRSGDVPKRLLGNYSGYLQVDGYDGYSKVCKDNKIIRLGCMNHCRSKFEKAFKSSNGKGTGKKGLIYLKKVYKIEEHIKDLPPERRYEIRLEKSKPILDEMKDWIDEVRLKITPTSLGGKAINYAYNEWPYLMAFLKDGRLEMTNILVENSIRPFAIGRRNFLFSQSVEGAEASALFYSLIETAKANGLEPLDYLTKMLEKLPYAKSIDDFEKLLPLKSKFKPELI